MEKKLEQIHEAALDILEQTGFRFMSDRALEVLKDNGIRILDDVARFTRDQVMTWVAKAPDAFTLHGADPRHDAIIGRDHSQCVTGYGCSAVCEWDGSRRDAGLEDYITFAKLVHQSPHFKINGGILAQPGDIPAEQSQLIMMYAAALCTDKCLLGIPGNNSQMQDIMELTAIRFRDRAEAKTAPRLLTMISTISPLQIDAMGVDAILASAAYQQPVIISPAPAAGTTGPIDLASNLALATAEALACIAFSQMACPGLPVVFGLQCYGSDLGSGNISIGSPAYALQAKYTAALARKYGLPSRCGGSTTDAKAVSCQSGYERMLSIFTAMQNRVNLIVHSAGILDNFAAISYEQFLIDLEIMDMARYYLDDIEVSGQTLNTDLIKQVGPGGEFLTCMDTMKKCRTHSWNPQIAVRKIGYDFNAHDDFTDNIRKQKARLLDQYTPPVLPAGILDRMDRFMLGRGVSDAVLKQIKQMCRNSHTGRTGHTN
ncbi:MAG: trimethylamine methyltransferase family protein [Desulfobacter sp.]